MGNTLKGEERHRVCPPAVKEAGKDSWRLGKKVGFLLCICLGQGSPQGSSLAVCTLSGAADVDLYAPPRTPALSEIHISGISLLISSAKFPANLIQSGLFWAVDCKSHQSSTALLAIATGIHMASPSAFLED